MTDSWETSTIGRVLNRKRARTTVEPGENETIPFVPMSLLPEDAAILRNWEMRQPTEIRSGVRFFSGDVLLAKITPCLENGKLAVVHELPGGAGMASTEVMPLTPNDQLTSDYLALFLAESNTRRALASKMQGATGRQRLPKEALEAYPISVPPLEEQRAITDVVRTVQETKQSCERIIVAARRLRTSLLRHLLAYGPVSSHDADLVRLKETECGPIPEGWRSSVIADHGTVMGSTIPFSELPNLDTADPKDPLVHAVKVSDMNLPTNGRQFNHSNIELHLPRAIAEKRAVPAGAVVFPKRGAAIGTNKKRLTTTWTLLDPNLIAVVPGSAVNPEFLFYWFQNFDLTTLVDPGPTPQLNRKNVDPLTFPVPPHDEQRRIADILRSVDRKIEAEEVRLHGLQGVFQSMLHHLMTGAVRLPEFVTKPS